LVLASCFRTPLIGAAQFGGFCLESDVFPAHTEQQAGSRKTHSFVPPEAIVYVMCAQFAGFTHALMRQ
jgi:hypothetical protein